MRTNKVCLQLIVTKSPGLAGAFLCSNFLAHKREYDYSRSGNPTCDVLAKTITGLGMVIFG